MNRIVPFKEAVRDHRLRARPKVNAARPASGGAVVADEFTTFNGQIIGTRLEPAAVGRAVELHQIVFENGKINRYPVGVVKNDSIVRMATDNPTVADGGRRVGPHVDGATVVQFPRSALDRGSPRASATTHNPEAVQHSTVIERRHRQVKHAPEIVGEIRVLR